MGRVKQEGISTQEEIDEVVAWFKYHEDALPDDVFSALLSNQDLVRLSLEDWRQGRPWTYAATKSATAHVALANRDHIRAERRRRASGALWMSVVMLSFTVTVCVAAVVYVLGVAR